MVELVKRVCSNGCSDAATKFTGKGTSQCITFNAELTRRLNDITFSVAISKKFKILLNNI